jgi:hypothetical protein
MYSLAAEVMEKHGMKQEKEKNDFSKNFFYHFWKNSVNFSAFRGKKYPCLQFE